MSLVQLGATDVSASSQKNSSVKDASKDKQYAAKTKPQAISISLLPIKGISKKLIEKLGENRIFDVASLLTRCKTRNQRAKIATALDVNVNHVNAWVKQADLWRVDGMTTDLAYLLVQAGIRSVQDLSRLSAAKVYPILKSLQIAQPDFFLPSEREIANVIKSAKDTATSKVFDVKQFQELLESKGGAATFSLDQIKNAISGLKDGNCDPYGFGDDSPVQYYADDVDSSNNDGNYSDQVLDEPWADIFQLDCILPLPRSISGLVKIRTFDNNGKPKLDEFGEQIVLPFDNAKVEIEGVVSPAEDKTEAAENPYCITDAAGRFIIALPERYCFKESVKIIISNSQGRQEFIKNSSDIICKIEEYDFVERIQDVLASRIVARSEISKCNALYKKGELTESDIGCRGMDFDEYLSSTIQKTLLQKTRRFNECLTRLSDSVGATSIYKKYVDVLRDFQYGVSQENDNSAGMSCEEAEWKRKEDAARDSECLYKLIRKFDSGKESSFDNYIQELFNYCLSKAKLQAVLEGVDSTPEDDGFVVSGLVFKENTAKEQKTLPSVKLMGDDDNPVMLSSDTAPSRMFTYSMLQRLVEPELSANGEKFDRESLKSPVNVDLFKEALYMNPEGTPQMSTLGMGYQLNMHQAWIPDGFALGDLLYSLILAPGEEQRLIVRENTQTYEIEDLAEGVDQVSEEYDNRQIDDTTAAYDYAVDQMMTGGSSFKSKSSSWGVGGSGAGAGNGFSLAISGSYSKSSSSGSSSAHQNNSQNEASAAAQKFQQNIKTASNRVAQAKRVSVSVASSNVSDSVATKIIANHNHSHAMTIQYWEVMRRYRLETAIDSVDLVLFVPLKTIKFLGTETSLTFPDEEMESFNKARFTSRYETVLKYSTALENALPYKYRSGLRLIKNYAACPKWVYEGAETGSKTVKFSFMGNFLSFDDITATLVLKNGRGRIAGSLNYYRKDIPTNKETRDALKSYIRDERNQEGSSLAECSFVLPSNVAVEDISVIKLSYSCEGLNYTLKKANLDYLQEIALANYNHKLKNFVEDNTDSKGDLKSMAHYMEALPESYRDPNVVFSARVLRGLGALRIHSVEVSVNGQAVSATLSSSTLSSIASVSLFSDTKTLRRSEFQKMEETLHHIVTDSLHYSQVIWRSLSCDERAMMLDKYTIQMNFDKLKASDAEGSNNTGKGASKSDGGECRVPLLNCINVRKMLGFYGNCMLFPFTFPEELADYLGRTAAEIQDQLYRYHTNGFRAPTTVISLPTKGMIGEAVLGQTNVSEVIDLTRFWNWQDSPIDKMEIDSSYLNGTDYLGGKTTKDISSMGLQSAAATTPVTAADLISALVAKQTPTFSDMTGMDQLTSQINANVESAAKGRDNIVNKTSAMATKALEIMNDNSKKGSEKESDSDKEKDNGGSGSGGSGSGGTGNGGSGGSGSGKGGSGGSGSGKGDNGGSGSGGSGSGGTGNGGSDNGSGGDDETEPVQPKEDEQGDSETPKEVVDVEQEEEDGDRSLNENDVEPDSEEAEEDDSISLSEGNPLIDYLKSVYERVSEVRKNNPNASAQELMGLMGFGDLSEDAIKELSQSFQSDNPDLVKKINS